MSLKLNVFWFTLAAFAWTATPAFATPQFARAYRLDCDACHTLPPVLNERGEDFAARGYRWRGIAPLASHATIPAAVWSTADLERRESLGLTRGFASRVEIISAGSLGRGASYFVEWRPVSQQMGSDGQLVDRAGRFEDLFVAAPVGRRGRWSLTIGQFRALSQTDVSRRLSISEPAALSSGLADTRPPAGSARLTGLRSFSPAGRQPGVRLTYHRGPAEQSADGWTAAITLPLTGELTVPFADAASFEFEARPKGVFGELFVRRGLSSVGAHGFAGDGRYLVQAIGTYSWGRRWAVTGVGGADRVAGRTRGRLSIGGEANLAERIAIGGRFDHRTGQRRPHLAIYANGHVPFGSPSLRQALRLQIEQSLQAGAVRTTVAISHVF